MALIPEDRRQETGDRSMMKKLKRRDFLKMAGLAVFCPKGLSIGHKPIKVHGAESASTTCCFVAYN